MVRCAAVFALELASASKRYGRRHALSQVDLAVPEGTTVGLLGANGAGGRRSRAALERLRTAGYAAWTQPGYADAAQDAFVAVFGASRVGVSAAGFAGATLAAP